MKNVLLLFTVFILVISCGQSEKDTMKPKKNVDSPCEILSETEIKDVLEIPADAATTMDEKNTTFPFCIYKWESITFPYIIEVGSMESEVDYPAELNIVLVKDGNKAKFDASTKVYDDGEVQDGIGEMAMWSDKKRQVTFLSKGYLIYTHVRISDDETVNKTKAIALAKLISKKL